MLYFGGIHKLNGINRVNWPLRPLVTQPTPGHPKRASPTITQRGTDLAVCIGKFQFVQKRFPTLRIIGPSYRGVWPCIAGFWDLQTTSFEIPGFLGYQKLYRNWFYDMLIPNWIRDSEIENIWVGSSNMQFQRGCYWRISFLEIYVYIYIVQIARCESCRAFLGSW